MLKSTLLSILLVEKFQRYFNIPFQQKLVIKYISGSWKGLVQHLIINIKKALKILVIRSSMFWMLFNVCIICKALHTFNSIVMFILFWSTYLEFITILTSVYSCSLLFRWTHLHGLVIFTNLHPSMALCFLSVALLHHTLTLHGASWHSMDVLIVHTYILTQFFSKPPMYSWWAGIAQSV
jgi:hypothetical protein